MNVDIWTSFTPDTSEQPCRTRCGYSPSEVLQTFEKTLNESGSPAAAKSLHFAADIVCSGGLEALFRSLWNHSLIHIGIASPRVFVYMNQRIKEVESILKTLPDQMAYSNETFQIRIGELVLVLRDAPTRPIVPWPKVGQETHTESWLRAIAVDPVTETTLLRNVWRSGADSAILRVAGANLCKAITDGSTEKALFWVKWLLDHEALLQKAQKGVFLSSMERGPSTLSSKARKHVSFFILHVYSELYKEFAAKQMVRMTEEFNSLLDLWTSPPKGLGANAKKQVLTILTQILTEVPKWKVPAAAPLIKDPVYMSNVVKTIPKFFQEVLSYDPPKRATELEKALRTKGVQKQKVVKKDAAVLSKDEAFDKAMEAYMVGTGRKA
jgi:hypothetical protein